MPKKMIRSAGHAYRGLHHAVSTERNIQCFLIVYIPLLLVGLLSVLRTWEWFAFLGSGMLFMSIELLNTAFERLADCVDDHCKKKHGDDCFSAIQHTKDIAASASLCGLIFVAVTILIIFVPRVQWIVLSM